MLGPIAPAISWARLHLLVVFLFTARLHGADPIAGSIKTIAGDVSVRRGTDTIAGKEGLHLLAKDVIRTAAGAKVGFILQDGTRISLGPDTELRIDEFVYDPQAGKFGLLLNLMRGAAAYISGKIAKFAPDTVRLETPVGVVGLRGTHFAVKLEAQP